MKRLVTYKRQTHSKEKSKVFQTNKVDDDAKLQVHSCCAEEEKKLSQYHCRNEMCSSGRVFDQRGFNTTMASCTSLDTSYTSIYHLSNVSNSVPVVISYPQVHNLRNSRVERRQWLPIGVNGSHMQIQLCKSSPMINFAHHSSPLFLYQRSGQTSQQFIL